MSIGTGIGRTVAALAALLCTAAIGLRSHAAEPPPGDGIQWRNESWLLPSPETAASQLLLVSRSPFSAGAGFPFAHEIRLTNLTDCPLFDVVLTQRFPPAFALVEAQPAPAELGPVTVWRLGNLAPRASIVIASRVMAHAEGTFEQCLAATWLPAVCQGIAVVAPRLAIAQAAPENALLCDGVPVTVTVTNAGSAPLPEVTVTTALPIGLTSPDGQQTVSHTVAALAPGAQAEHRFVAAVGKTGQYTIRTDARTPGGLAADATSTVVVRQPVLSLHAEASATQFAGRAVTWKIAVANTGDAPATGVLVTGSLPAGVTFLEASDGGALFGDNVRWRFDQLAPGSTTALTLSARADTIGTVTSVISVRAECVDPINAVTSTSVVGIAAVLIECVDLADPIEIGKEGVYRIKVTNQGTADDTNLRLVCTLEPSQTYVSSAGPTAGALAGQEVQFALLERLPPGRAEVWEVRVRASQAGDVRFRAQLASTQLQRPVHETESTSQY